MAETIRDIHSRGLSIWLTNTQFEDLLDAINASIRAKEGVLDSVLPNALPSLQESHQRLVGLRNHLQAYSKQ